MADIKERIGKDLRIFDDNVSKIDFSKLTNVEKEVVDLAKMYASDAATWLEKGDLYTSFSSISYAHGLLDAIRKIRNLDG